MGSLWVTNDVLAQERLNRARIMGHLLAPVYDVDDAAAVTVDVKAVDGDDIITTETTHWTAGGAIAFALVDHVAVLNNDTVRQQASVHLVASAGSRSVSNQILGESLFPGELLEIPGPWIVGASATLRSISAAAAAGKVALTAAVTEFASVPAGLAFPIHTGSALTTALVAYYTCPASGVRHAMAAPTICNTHTSQVVVTIEVRPSGGAQADRQNRFNAALFPGETRILRAVTLEPGDAVYAKAATGAVVGVRMTALEFA